ncbi:polysaccharide lyase family 7 protein [Pseudomonas sp. LP_7_YM]|uniref:polysaccharide lyase family 7 protein n=1 Tax=Pseudomonas sp. LP_7_YM TaxID=2485137 RepID=UPI00105C3FA0|nr:polysaccharide lyase family 7 protein [Pseudomonas sp. LP_7_YM]
MIDLATWNLSEPVGTPAVTISTPTLTSGYEDGYFRSGDTLFFWAPVTGSKTDNAIYPRTELRETYANGTAHNWMYSQADNYLRAALSVDQVPSSGKIVIGQIHCYGSTEPLFKLEYQYKDKTKTGNIVGKFRLTPTSEPQVIQIATGVLLKERFSYVIHLTPAGDLSVDAHDMQWSAKLDASWSTRQLYFKAGVYVQDNTGYTSEGGAATFYKLQISHEKQA